MRVVPEYIYLIVPRDHGGCRPLQPSQNEKYR